MLNAQDLQSKQNHVAPTVAPEIEKGAILDALKSMDKDTLIALLAEVLSGQSDGA